MTTCSAPCSVDEATALQPRPDWDDVTRRAARVPGPRRWAVPVGVAAVAAAATVVVAVVLAGGGEQAVDVTTDPAPDAATTTALDPTDPDPTGTPRSGYVTDEVVQPIDLPTGDELTYLELVALVIRDTDDGGVQDLVVIDPDGTVLRTLVPGISGAEGGAYHLALTPDRRTLLYSVGTSACTSLIQAVAVDGSAPEQTLFEGNQVAVSPDGRWLALDPRSSCEADDAIELLPLGGGVKLRYGHPGSRLSGLEEGRNSSGISDLAWADPETLLYAVTDEEGGTSIHLLDAAEATTEPYPGAGPGTLTSLEPAPSGGVVSVSSCCPPGPLTHHLVVLGGVGGPYLLEGPASHAVMTPALGWWAIDAGSTTVRVQDGVIRTDVAAVVG